MVIGPGTRVGSYEVIALIGQGGMGEVYRAIDTNLKRTVAIRALAQAVATDPERLSRFQREAEVLARLNHPNIAQIHRLERSDGATALVMELHRRLHDPEQARRNTVDKRADIWAFGTVLYEMLTGRRAIAGHEVSEVLASVLAREPDWTALPADLPPVLATFIRRCQGWFEELRRLVPTT